MKKPIENEEIFGVSYAAGSAPEDESRKVQTGSRTSTSTPSTSMSI
jgi:hypothetical protein